MDDEMEKLRIENERLKEKLKRKNESLRRYLDKPGVRERIREKARQYYRDNREKVLEKKKQKYHQSKMSSNINGEQHDTETG